MEKYGVETTEIDLDEKIAAESGLTIGSNICGECGGDLEPELNYCKICRKVPSVIKARIET
jgi:hypothetical protein